MAIFLYVLFLLDLYEITINTVAALDPIILIKGSPISVATLRPTMTLTLNFSLCTFPLA